MNISNNTETFMSKLVKPIKQFIDFIGSILLVLIALLFTEVGFFLLLVTGILVWASSQESEANKHLIEKTESLSKAQTIICKNSLGIETFDKSNFKLVDFNDRITVFVPNQKISYDILHCDVYQEVKDEDKK